MTILKAPAPNRSLPNVVSIVEEDMERFGRVTVSLGLEPWKRCCAWARALFEKCVHALSRGAAALSGASKNA